MRGVISNTSPLLYLHRISALGWLPDLFDEIWIPPGVVIELQEGQRRGHDVPIPEKYPCLQVVKPRMVPSKWLVLDLGAGELETMSLALENKDCVVLLDDALARRIAQAAGLTVWGTLKVVLEAKARGHIASITPIIGNLKESGMWISAEIRDRILALAGEKVTPDV